jgi:hypothetical protein
VRRRLPGQLTARLSSGRCSPALLVLAGLRASPLPGPLSTEVWPIPAGARSVTRVSAVAGFAAAAVAGAMSGAFGVVGPVAGVASVAVALGRAVRVVDCAAWRCWLRPAAVAGAGPEAVVLPPPLRGLRASPSPLPPGPVPHPLIRDPLMRPWLVPRLPWSGAAGVVAAVAGARAADCQARRF